MQKRNDYNRHKLLRKIRRQRKAQVEQQKVAAEKELKRRLRVTPPKFGDGKDPIDTSKIDELSYVYAPPRIDEYGNTVVYANDPLGVEGDGIRSPLQLRRPVMYGTQLLDEVIVPGSKYAKEAGKQNFNLTKGEAMQMEDFDKLQNLMHKSTFGKRLSNDKDAILVDPQTAYDAFHDYTIASELKRNLSTPSRYNMATLADMSSGERVNMVGFGIPAAINTAAMFGGGIPGMLASGFDIGVYKNESSIYGSHYRGMLRKPKLGNVIQTVNQNSDYGLKIEMGDEPRFKSSHKFVRTEDLPKPYSETIQRLENDFYGYKKEASQGYPYRVYDESLKGVSGYRIQNIFDADMTTYYRLKDKCSSETQSQCSKVEKIQNDIAERGSITESQYLQYRRELRKLHQMIEKDVRIDHLLSSDAAKNRAEMSAAQQTHGLKKSKLKRDVTRLEDERDKRQLRENAMYHLHNDKYTLYPDFYTRQVSKPDRALEATLSSLVGFGVAPMMGALASELSTSEKTKDEFYEKLNKPKIQLYKKSKHKSLRQKK